jgi:hypothetical protein
MNYRIFKLPVVRKTSGEGRSVIESVLRSALRQLERGIESINGVPIVQDGLLLLGEGELVRERGEARHGREGDVREHSHTLPQYRLCIQYMDVLCTMYYILSVVAMYYVLCTLLSFPTPPSLYPRLSLYTPTPTPPTHLLPFPPPQAHTSPRYSYNAVSQWRFCLYLSYTFHAVCCTNLQTRDW